jgi:hypothetical protein
VKNATPTSLAFCEKGGKWDHVTICYTEKNTYQFSFFLTVYNWLNAKNILLSIYIYICLCLSLSPYIYLVKMLIHKYGIVGETKPENKVAVTATGTCAFVSSQWKPFGLQIKARMNQWWANGKRYPLVN